MIDFGSVFAGQTAWSELVWEGAPGAIRTHTGRVLNLAWNIVLTCANRLVRRFWGTK
jgi:hypothetical protein